MQTLKWISAHAETIRIGRDEMCCLNCKHFNRHYVRFMGYFTPINIGHCMYPRLKNRSAEQSCKYFERGTES